jgi:hypothetical protein
VPPPHDRCGSWTAGFAASSANRMNPRVGDGFVVGVRRPARQRGHHLLFLEQPVDRSTTQGCLMADVRAHRSACRVGSWKSSSFANTRPGSRLRSMKSCSRSATPLACGSRGLQYASRPSAGRRTRRTPRSRARRGRAVRLGDPRPAAAAARPATEIPASRSGVCSEKIGAPAPAHEEPRHATITTRAWAGRARPAPRSLAPRDRSGRPRPADRPLAEPFAAAERTSAGPRAGSHRRSS